MTTVAAIDCGTNSIKVLIAGIGDEGGLQVVLRDSRVVRLGQGVDATLMLADEALERTFAAIDEFAEVIRGHGVPPERIRFCATSATRDAGNAAVFAEGVRRRLGVEPEVLSGDEEAALVFAGAMAAQDPMPPEPVLVVDIGGGSTELVLGEGDEADLCLVGFDGVLDGGDVPVQRRPDPRGDGVGVAATEGAGEPVHPGRRRLHPRDGHRSRVNA